MIKTHEDFKSIDPKVRDVEALNRLIGEALKSQVDFERGTTIGETYFNDANIESFNIDLEKIDRLYYINYQNDEIDRKSYTLLGRMDYNGEIVFFELSIIFDISNIYINTDNSWGYIFISTDADRFIKSVSDDDDEYPIDLIRQSLREDGIEIDVNIEKYCCYYWVIENDLPPFTDMCNLDSYDLHQRLRRLNKDIGESLNHEFIEYIELRRHYEKMYD